MNHQLRLLAMKKAAPTSNVSNTNTVSANRTATEPQKPHISRMIAESDSEDDGDIIALLSLSSGLVKQETNSQPKETETTTEQTNNQFHKSRQFQTTMPIAQESIKPPEAVNKTNEEIALFEIQQSFIKKKSKPPFQVNASNSINPLLKKFASTNNNTINQIPAKSIIQPIEVKIEEEESLLQQQQTQQTVNQPITIRNNQLSQPFPSNDSDSDSELTPGELQNLQCLSKQQTNPSKNNNPPIIKPQIKESNHIQQNKLDLSQFQSIMDFNEDSNSDSQNEFINRNNMNTNNILQMNQRFLPVEEENEFSVCIPIEHDDSAITGYNPLNKTIEYEKKNMTTQQKQLPQHHQSTNPYQAPYKIPQLSLLDKFKPNNNYNNATQNNKSNPLHAQFIASSSSNITVPEITQNQSFQSNSKDTNSYKNGTSIYQGSQQKQQQQQLPSSYKPHQIMNSEQYQQYERSYEDDSITSSKQTSLSGLKGKQQILENWMKPADSTAQISYESKTSMQSGYKKQTKSAVPHLTPYKVNLQLSQKRRKMKQCVEECKVWHYYLDKLYNMTSTQFEERLAAENSIPKELREYNIKSIHRGNYNNKKIPQITVVIIEIEILHSIIKATLLDFSGSLTGSFSKNLFMDDKSDQNVILKKEEPEDEEFDVMKETEEVEEENSDDFIKRNPDMMRSNRSSNSTKPKINYSTVYTTNYERGTQISLKMNTLLVLKDVTVIQQNEEPPFLNISERNVVSIVYPY